MRLKARCRYCGTRVRHFGDVCVPCGAGKCRVCERVTEDPASDYCDDCFAEAVA